MEIKLCRSIFAEAKSIIENKAAAATTLQRTGQCFMLLWGWLSVILPDMKSELVECDFTATARIKGKSAENQWQSVLGSASCAYWADMQLYRTTGSVQQEQESSPLTSKAEHTGPLSTGGSIVGTTSNLRKCIKIKRRFWVLACTLVGYISWTQIKSSVMLQPTFIFLFQVAGYRQMTGIWHQTVYGCPAIPSSSAAAERTQNSHSAEEHALQSKVRKRSSQVCRSHWRVNKYRQFVICGQTKHCWPRQRSSVRHK